MKISKGMCSLALTLLIFVLAGCQATKTLPGPEAAVVYGDELIQVTLQEEGSYAPDGFGTLDYSYHVPALAGDSETVKAINREVEAWAGEPARAALNCIKSGELCDVSCVDWSAHWQDSLLSLVVSAEEVYGHRDYLVIHYDYGSDTRLDNRQMIQSLGLQEDAVLTAARRAAAQAFDRSYDAYPHDRWSREQYYMEGSGSSSTGAPLCRAGVICRIDLDTAAFYQDKGAVYCLAPDGQGSWGFGPMALDLDGPAGLTKTVGDQVVTARLEDDRVYLSFADTEEAAYYLLGYGEAGFDYAYGGRGYALPGDSLALGDDAVYEVQGLYSRYVDIYLGNLGPQYMPFLFLRTAEGGVEMVDIANGFRYGLFCAMPVPGLFDGEFVAGEGEDGQSTVWITDRDGVECDLGLWAVQAQDPPFRGSRSGVLDEVSVEGGSYAVVADLYFGENGFLKWFISQLDTPVASARSWLIPLGVTDDGYICAYQYDPENGKAPTAGTFAFLPGAETTELGTYETLSITVLTGISPYGREGETLTFYAPLEDEDLSLRPFPGEWMDVNSGRCTMEIIPMGTGSYEITLEWGDSASTYYQWSMTATPSQDGTALCYEGSAEKKITSWVSGAVTEDVVATGGAGRFVMPEPGVLLWEDAAYPGIEDCRFERMGGVG